MPLLNFFWHLFAIVMVARLVYSQSKMDLGYPAGFMSECLGSTKPADIPKSQLRYLGFHVQGNGGRRQKYNYWNARNMANDPKIDFKRKTFILALGYLDSPHFPIATMFANEYEAKGYNVILVDNQRFSTVHYYLASRLMRPVGKHVAEVLVQLTQLGLDPGLIELVGFSLGGHTVSYIASNYRNMTGRNISTIIGLEPSGPCFRNLDSTQRLDRSNADFVVVLHTNIDVFGMAAPMGHVDFYVNGGEYQPSDIQVYPCTSTCSHFRVLTLWLSTLRHPKKFTGLRCESIQQARDSKCYGNSPLVVNDMGLDVDRNKTGIFYVTTSRDYPYFLGVKGLREEYVYWNIISDVNNGDETEIFT